MNPLRCTEPDGVTKPADLLDGSASLQGGQDDGDCGLRVAGVVDLGAPDGDGRGGLGGNAVAQASHVALWGGDLKVIAGVRLKVGNDGLSQPSVHLHLLTVILHLEDGSRLAFSEQRLVTLHLSHTAVGLVRSEHVSVSRVRDSISKK